jgi:hypothetical protein
VNSCLPHMVVTLCIWILIAVFACHPSWTTFYVVTREREESEMSAGVVPLCGERSLVMVWRMRGTEVTGNCCN